MVGTVLDLPVGRPVLARSQYSMAEMYHMQPSPYGLNDPLPSVFDSIDFFAILGRDGVTATTSLPAQMPWFDLYMGKEAAMADGLKWLCFMNRLIQQANLLAPPGLDIVATPLNRQMASGFIDSTRRPIRLSVWAKNRPNCAFPFRDK